MTRATSLFLDVLRLVAALVVFAAHTAHYWNPALSDVMQVWAHDAVVVFFVLSGYVIAHTARPGAGDGRHYVVARLSRLYSVVAPALLLTAALRWVGREFDPELYASFERVFPALRFLASALLMNEVWTLEISPPTNTPFWSLGYEFWYYVFFGAVVFIKPRGLKWLVAGGAALIAGPKILLLLPVWLVGVAAYRGKGAFPRLAGGWAWAALAGAAALTGLALLTCQNWPVKPGAHPWYFSGAAISDLVKGLGWGATIWGFNRAASGAKVPEGLLQPVRWLAGHTFSLYLYHAPLVVFATALFPPASVGPMGWLIILGSLLLVIAGLGALTEAQRPRWQRALDALWGRVAARIG